MWAVMLVFVCEYGALMFVTGCDCVYVNYSGLQACSGGHEERVRGEQGSEGSGRGCSTGEASWGGELGYNCLWRCGAM